MLSKKFGKLKQLHFHEIFLAAPKIKTNRHKFEQRIYLVSINLTSSIQVRDYAHLHQWHMLSSVFCTCSSCSGGTFFWKKCVHRMMILSFAFFFKWKILKGEFRQKSEEKEKTYFSATKNPYFFLCLFFFTSILYYYVLLLQKL